MRSPRQIVLDMSSKCNMKCLNCPTTDPNSKFKPGHMDTDLIMSVMDRIVEEKINTSITSNLLGESLLHPDIYQIYVRMVALKIPFTLTTNSSLWNQEVFDLLTEYNSCYQIIFSQNGLHEDKSYSLETCMQGINRRESMKNIKAVLDMRNRKKSNTSLGIKITNRGQDYEEIEEMIDYWLNEGGADFVAVGKLLVDTKRGMRIFPCRYSDDFAMEIRSDGTAIACGWQPEVTNDLALNFGKLPLTGSLIDFYNNPAYRAFRKVQYLGDFPIPCDKCSIPYTGDGIIGKVNFRGINRSRKAMYYHEDYSNTFYSYKNNKSRISFLREWKPDQEIVDEILNEGKRLYWL